MSRRREVSSGLNFVFSIYEVNERALRNKECGVRARDWRWGGGVGELVPNADPSSRGKRGRRARRQRVGRLMVAGEAEEQRLSILLRAFAGR